MICEKCGFTNNYGVNYCEKCGEKFSKETKQAEYDETVWAKIEEIEDGYNKLSFKKITGHIAFKIAVLLIVLGIGLFKIYSYGTTLRFIPNDSYEISYSESLDEYYITPKQERLDFELYIPFNIKTVELVGYDADGNQVMQKTLSRSEVPSEMPDMSSGEYNTLVVNTLKGDKIADSLKIKYSK